MDEFSLCSSTLKADEWGILNKALLSSLKDDTTWQETFLVWKDKLETVRLVSREHI